VNIQPSVLIWTIICFCLFMLILNNLLFKPMLKFMDERNERIERGRMKKIENEKAAEIAAAELKDAQEKIARRNAVQMASALENARNKAAAIITAAHHESAQNREQLHEELKVQRRELEGQLDAETDALAAAFAERMVSGL